MALAQEGSDLRQGALLDVNAAIEGVKAALFDQKAPQVCLLVCVRISISIVCFVDVRRYRLKSAMLRLLADWASYKGV